MSGSFFIIHAIDYWTYERPEGEHNIEDNHELKPYFLTTPTYANTYRSAGANSNSKLVERSGGVGSGGGPTTLPLPRRRATT